MSIPSVNRPPGRAASHAPRQRAGLAVAAAVTATAALAQEPPGAEFYLDLATGLAGNSNYYTVSTPTGNSYYWNNDFALGYSSQTKGTAFNFETGGILNLGYFSDSPDGENYDFKDPFGQLSFQTESRDSLIGANVRYRETNNSFRVNQDEDLNSNDLILDSGYRQDLDVGANIELGRTGPVSFEGDLGYLEQRYHDTTNSNLSDRNKTDVALQAGFDLTDTLSLLAVGSYFDNDNISDTKPDWTTATAGLGLEGDVNDSLSFRTSLAYGQNETTKTVNGDRETTTIERPVFDFFLDQARPNGSITVDFNSRLETTGLITELRFGRSFDTQRGAFGFALGASQSESGGVYPVGNLNWLREYKHSQFSVRFNNAIKVNDEDQEALNSSLRFLYQHEVTQASGFNVALNVANSYGLDDDANDYQQAGVTLNYFRDVTRDWQFVTGYRFNYSNDNDDETTENVVFATFDRRFSFRP